MKRTAALLACLPWLTAACGSVDPREAELREALRESESRQGAGFRRLEILAELRRFQGRADPLTIHAPPVWGQREYEWPDPIEVEVTVTNTDPDGESFLWRMPPYENQWRFEIRDADGRQQPIQVSDLRHVRGMTGGGLLGPGKSWTGRLRMYCYVEPLEPGTYTIRVQYSDNEPICDLAKLDGLLTFGSGPFRLTVLKSPRWLKAQEKR
jgi:hypothetical protein